MNEFKRYAERNHCSIAEAIKARDFVATRDQVIAWFKEAEGRDPVDAEIEFMSPESDELVREETEYFKVKDNSKQCSCGEFHPYIPGEARLVQVGYVDGFQWNCWACNSTLFFPLKTETKAAM